MGNICVQDENWRDGVVECTHLLEVRGDPQCLVPEAEVGGYGDTVFADHGYDGATVVIHNRLGWSEAAFGGGRPDLPCSLEPEMRRRVKQKRLRVFTCSHALQRRDKMTWTSTRLWSRT